MRLYPPLLSWRGEGSRWLFCWIFGDCERLLFGSLLDLNERRGGGGGRGEGLGMLGGRLPERHLECGGHLPSVGNVRPAAETSPWVFLSGLITKFNNQGPSSSFGSKVVES